MFQAPKVLVSKLYFSGAKVQLFIEKSKKSGKNFAD